MYKSIVILAVSVSILVIANVRADVLTFQYGLTTSGADGWQVAALYLDGEAGYVNPTKNKSGYYDNAASATKWNELWLDTAVWNDATQGNRNTWTNYGDWVAAEYGNESKVNNGFFAFKYTLTAADITAESVVGQLSLTLGADDYIAAIYANGEQLYSAGIKNNEKVGDDTNGLGGWLNTWEETFDVNLVESMLDLIFVVHNTNAAGSSNINPMGLYVDGMLSTNIEMIIGGGEPSEGAATPEPATLALMGLGLAGVGAAARRRMKK